jgi:NAD(P)-dependent dehydrogenase (short-subunit alcohol dehydrogenase family)
MNIIITGASRGIGFEAAKKFASDPANRVFALARSQAGLDELSRRCAEEACKGVLKTYSFDLAKGPVKADLLKEIIAFVPFIDVLVNNAGSLVNKPFEILSEDDFNLIFDANVKSAFLLSQAVLPYLAEGSHIVNIGSMGGFQGSMKFKGLSLYSASKGALAILSECMAEELKDKKIRVNCLALGSAQTEMLSQAFPGYKAPVTAKEMADFIVDFALRGHKWFNGKILPVSLATP